MTNDQVINIKYIQLMPKFELMCTRSKGMWSLR